MQPKLIDVAIERFPIRGAFVISRETRTEQVVVTVTVGDGRHQGRAECVPYKRYGETPEGVIAAIRQFTGQPLDRAATQSAMPPGAARNGLDCALWDFEAKAAGQRAWQLAGIAAPLPLVTCFTLSLGTPDAMAAAARAVPSHPVLKIKLGGAGDPERIRAVRAAAPRAVIVADANEAWTPDVFDACMAACVEIGVAMIEQPLPADADDLLGTIARPIPVCADESLHDRRDLRRLRSRYDAINIKLDKAGGLTEAMLLRDAARAEGFKIMVGCMLSTSLAMAPALLVAQGADVIDLDGPLLLARDRAPGLRYAGATVQPASADLWG